MVLQKQPLDDALRTLTRLNPYYVLEMDEDIIRVLNKESQKAKYQVRIPNQSEGVRSLITQYNTESVRTSDLDETIHREPRIGELLSRLNNIVFVSEDTYKLQLWILRCLDKHRTSISPKDRYLAFERITKWFVGEPIVCLTTSNTPQWLIEDELKSICHFETIRNMEAIPIESRCVVLLTERDLTFEEQLRLHEKIDARTPVLNFSYDRDSQTLKLGPRIRKAVHGCMRCVELTEEKTLSKNDNIGIDAYSQLLMDTIIEELIFLLLDEYFMYTTHFSSIAGKQYVFDGRSREVFLKQIRKHPNCEICLPLKGGETNGEQLRHRVGT